ncbi:MAG: chromate efflux transporter [Gammaproteobacteria bacterium]|nr:chromate efflux transporter [Gammaproteobacteria bacterium]
MNQQKCPIPFKEALTFWFKLGFISFGGPAGQVALMHEELVNKRGWISEKRFLHALNYCMLLPGPEAQQLATYLGWLMHRSVGGILAGLFFILPSLLLMLLLSWLYLTYGHMELVSDFFFGIKPVVTAIVFHAAIRIARRSLTSAPLKIIALLAFLSIVLFDVPYPAIVFVAALCGTLCGVLWPEKQGQTSGHGAIKEPSRPAIIDDDSPTPAHAIFRRAHMLRVALIGLMAFLLPMAFLIKTYGPDHLLTALSWFFTKAALLTFGGAYAVLPYVYHGVVEEFHWLTPGQMIDSLALGETTPGPLIMFVTFVAFMTGYLKEALGPHLLFEGGLVAGLLVTWFTFLPSFVFILLGGPLVESTREDIRFKAPLSAITAAVVGVIFNLALFLAYHLLWPEGLEGSMDLASLSLAMIAGIALFHYQRSVMEVIIAGGLMGLLMRHLLH